MKFNDHPWKLEVKHVPQLGDLKLVHVSGATHEYPRHLHEEYCVVVILQGTETHICRGKSYTAFPGDILLLNAEEAHANSSAAVKYKAIQIKPGSFDRIFARSSEDISRYLYFDSPVIRDAELFRSLVNLYASLEQDIPPLEQEFEFVRTIGSLVRRYNKDQNTGKAAGSESRGGSRYVREVREYLRSHHSENISLSRLASIANLSAFHLARIFCAQTGVPPHEYLTQARITAAQRLLHEGYSIAEAAIETGFFDQSHFSRNFKRITGFTPGNYLSHSNIIQDTPKQLR